MNEGIPLHDRAGYDGAIAKGRFTWLQANSWMNF